MIFKFSKIDIITYFGNKLKYYVIWQLFDIKILELNLIFKL